MFALPLEPTPRFKKCFFSPVFLTNQMVLRKIQVKGGRVTLSGCGGLYVMTPYISGIWKLGPQLVASV